MANTGQENKTVCPVCDSDNTSMFFSLDGMPINVCIQWASRSQALGCPKGDIRLAFCGGCGFVWNTAFDAGRVDYSSSYENSLFFSALYQEYTDNLIDRLIGRYNLRNKDVIDIGCGKGEFLLLLCRRGDNRGVGFDTSYQGNGDGNDSVKIIRDFYSDKYAHYKADLVCSRYVFEHIERPKAFLEMVRKAIGRHGSVVYFEVPNVSLILRDLSVWDIIYEHCCYFCLSSLERVFSVCGFDVLDLYQGYQGQFLGIEAIPGNGRTRSSGRYKKNLQEIGDEVERFVGNNHKQIQSWQSRLKNIAAMDKRAVLWGAGAKGVSFFNMLGITDQIRYVVDINPRKHGKYIPGTGQQIVSPEFLREYKPDILVLANPIYKSEIQRTVKTLGINPEFM
jgi:SAM-dependent methyltransferase